MVVPNVTCELEGWSVVQVIVADVVVMPVTTTALIAGIDAGVEKLKLPDVAVPAEFAEVTA